MSEKTRYGRIEKLSQTINEALDSYIENPSLMAELYSFYKQFHNYSLRNQLLIKNQYKGSIQVSSYKNWQEKGYHVQKGEKAIYILAPNSRKIITDLDGKNLGFLNNASKEYQRKIKQGKLKVKDKIIGYRPVPVFDIRQTDCPIEEYPRYFQQFHLIGKAQHYEEMLSALSSYRDSVGVTQIEGVIAHQQAQGANGFCIPDKKIIYINKDLSQLGYLSTYIHELAHSQLHKDSRLKTHEEEYQAELTAGVVTGYFGLETQEKVTHYLHNWTENKTITQKEQLVNQVMKLSDQMIEHIEHHLEKEYNLSKDQQKHRFYTRDLDFDGAIDIYDHDSNDSKVQSLGSLDDRDRIKGLNNRLDQLEQSRRNHHHISKQERQKDEAEKSL